MVVLYFFTHYDRSWIIFKAHCFYISIRLILGFSKQILVGGLSFKVYF